MKKSFLLLLPALLLVSCETPAPIIISNPRPAPSYPSSSSSYTPSSTAPAPATRTTYAYPNIAGVWKGPSGTITIGASYGGPFPVTIVQRGGQVNSTTGHWGQPYHRHFKFARANGSEAVATLNSLTPTVIAIKNESGREMTWTRVAGL
jgi:hypothetical protein